MTVIEALIAAKNLIAEKGLAKGNYAVNSIGNRVSFHSHEAVAYCALGAIAYFTEENGMLTQDTMFFLRNAVKTISGTNNGISQWNDAPNRSKEDVLHAFDVAIEFAEKSSNEESSRT